MKYVSIDLEMTGLDPETCQILQFGAVIEDTENIKPLEDLPVFNCYILQDIYKGEVDGISMNSKIFEKLRQYKNKLLDTTDLFTTEKNVGFYFKKFLIDNGIIADKNNRVNITVAGKNFGASDLNFINKLPNFKKHISISSKIIDPGILYFNPEIDTSLPGLSACLRRANKPFLVSHTAVEDALDVIKLIRNIKFPIYK